MQVRFPKVVVQLSDHDGNVFSVIRGVVSRMKEAGLHTEAQQFKRDAFACRNYNAVLQLALATVTVE